MPTILLINDDGIHATGLMAIKKKLNHLGKVVVVAPKHEISGIGKAITSARHVQIEKVELSDGSKAYAINGGTPADAYLLAVHKILKHAPDIVVAGINLGPNLGIDDFLNSGTIGAAMEAAIHGVPAVALSYCKREIDDQEAAKSTISLQKLELTASIGQKIVEYILKKGLPRDTDLISVNVPENAEDTKLKITTLSYVGYGDLFTKEAQGYRIAHWRLADYKCTHYDTDVHAVRDEGCVSITPVRIRMRHSKKGSERMLKEAFRNANE
jgi:5'-nucleotidase